MKVFTRLWHSWKWWTVIALLMADFAVLAYVIGPPPDREATTEFEAYNTLVISTDAPIDLTASRVELELTTGPLPVAAATALGLDDVTQLSSHVDIIADDELSTVEVWGFPNPDPDFARLAVDTITALYSEHRWAEQTAARALEVEQIQIDKRLLEREIEIADSEIARQLAASAADDENPLDPSASSIDYARRDALVVNYGAVLRDELRLSRPIEPDVTPAGDVVVEESEIGGFNTPLNKLSMGVIGAVLGLLIGLGAVALSYNFTDRVDDRLEAEAAFGSTVLADIPRIPWKLRRRSKVVTFEEPQASASGAYRHLRTMMNAISSQRSKRADGKGTVYLVASAHAAEGKSTTVANLAAAFSDSGEDVIVISGDLRRPSIHELLGVGNASSGILSLTGDATAEEIEARLARTSLPRVRLLHHGEAVNNPGELLASRLGVIERCRELAPTVIIDAPPALVGNDVAELLPATDYVLVTVRAHATQTRQARAARRLLGSLGADVIGIAIVESHEDTTQGYRYGKRNRPSLLAKIFGKLRRSRTRGSEHVDPAPSPEPITAMPEAPKIAARISANSAGVADNGTSVSSNGSSTSGNGTSPSVNGDHGIVEVSASAEGPPKADGLDTDLDEDDVDAELAMVLARQESGSWSQHRTR